MPALGGGGGGGGGCAPPGAPPGAPPSAALSRSPVQAVERGGKTPPSLPADSLDVACFSVSSSGPQYLFCFAVSIVRLKDVDEMRSGLKMLPCRQQPGFGM